MLKNKKLELGLLDNSSQIGAWTNLANPLVCEIIGSLGFDWILIDAEHGPNSVPSVLSQLQAIAPYATIPIVRIPNHDASLIKRYLDIGVANLLIPFVDSAKQAEDIIQATRYPPRGIRGVGAGLARASRWGSNKEYLHEANNQISVIAQIESLEGLSRC
jgi:4-hydroxy-2-oxoheptanedioate aldolase